jgi:hypothetical protein
LIAYSVAIPLGLLYTRILEREKIDALRLNKWNFDAKMMLSNECFEVKFLNKLLVIPKKLCY